MAYSEAQNRATQKYVKNNYDTFVVRVKKGDKKKYDQQAKDKGYSLNAYINHLLEKDRMVK